MLSWPTNHGERVVLVGARSGSLSRSQSWQLRTSGVRLATGALERNAVPSQRGRPCCGGRRRVPRTDAAACRSARNRHLDGRLTSLVVSYGQDLSVGRKLRKAVALTVVRRSRRIVWLPTLAARTALAPGPTVRRIERHWATLKLRPQSLWSPPAAPGRYHRRAPGHRDNVARTKVRRAVRRSRGHGVRGGRIMQSRWVDRPVVESA
jgi:hypothetical protein